MSSPANVSPGKRKPTLSVLLPNYNHSQFLPRSIDAILNQVRRPDEFLIVDDASTDNSMAILSDYAARFPLIRLYRNEKNLGVVGTLRRLFSLSIGDYINSYAADDERLPNFFSRAMELAEQYPQAGMIFGKVVMYDTDSREEGELEIHRWQTTRYATPDEYLRDAFEAEPPSHSLSSATIYRRDALDEIGFFDPALGSWADTFACHAIALKYGAVYSPERFGVWRKQAKSYSQRTLVDPRKSLDVVARSVARMRAPDVRDRFPESVVRRWSRRYRWRIVREYWRGDHTGELPPGSPLWRRLAYRLPRTLEALRLAMS